MAIHRVFISYHHRSDQGYKETLVEFGEKHGIFMERDRFSRDWMLALSNKLWPRPRIVHPWPTARFAVNHRR